MAFMPREPQSHSAHAATRDRTGGAGRGPGWLMVGTLLVWPSPRLARPCPRADYDWRMPVPAPSPDARAVVTGASQNIGTALATELAARGHNLIVTARREELLNELAARLTDKYRVTVEVRPA